MLSILRRKFRGLRQSTLEKIYGITSRNWHLLDTVPLHSISTSVLKKDVSYFGEAQIHDPNGAARIWPQNSRALSHHLEPQIIPRPYVMELSDALVSHFTIVETANPAHAPIEVFPETMRSREHIHFMDKTKHQRKSLAQRYGNKEPDYDCGYLFGSIGWQNYYHTLVDHAVRYSEFQAAGKIPEEAHIIFPKTPNSYQTAILDLLRIAPDRRVFADGNCIKVKNLLIPSMRRHGRAVTRIGLEAFRSQVLGNLPSKAYGGARCVYLTRRGASQRRVVNEAEVETLLRMYGIETVQTEHMSVVEQAQLFSNAQVIVGPHGAGLANAVFADAPHVIEFLPADLWDLGYYIGLAISCGGTYDGIVCGGVAPGDDITVDLTVLEAALSGCNHLTRAEK